MFYNKYIKYKSKYTDLKFKGGGLQNRVQPVSLPTGSRAREVPCASLAVQPLPRSDSTACEHCSHAVHNPNDTVNAPPILHNTNETKETGNALPILNTTSYFIAINKLNSVKYQTIEETNLNLINLNDLDYISQLLDLDEGAVYTCQINKKQIVPLLIFDRYATGFNGLNDFIYQFNGEINRLNKLEKDYLKILNDNTIGKESKDNLIKLKNKLEKNDTCPIPQEGNNEILINKYRYIQIILIKTDITINNIFDLDYDSLFKPIVNYQFRNITLHKHVGIPQTYLCNLNYIKIILSKNIKNIYSIKFSNDVCMDNFIIHIINDEFIFKLYYLRHQLINFIYILYNIYHENTVFFKKIIDDNDRENFINHLTIMKDNIINLKLLTNEEIIVRALNHNINSYFFILEKKIFFKEETLLYLFYNSYLPFNKDTNLSFKIIFLYNLYYNKFEIIKNRFNILNEIDIIELTL